MNNVNTGTISVDDMLKLKGLKDCWEFVLNTIEEELTIDYIKKVHFQICKGQNITPHGNKRVANLIANKEMIKHGQGIISIPVEKIGDYFTYLINYYETGNIENIKKWIYQNCIDGIE